MRIEHLAVWVDDIEKMRTFYLTYFDAVCGEKYVNPNKNYTSYFLSFGEGGCRIELMHRPDISDNTSAPKRGFVKGLAHFAVSLGSADAVTGLTERLRADGYVVEGEPRTTGDGYFESIVLDPEGNFIEITE